MVGDGGIGEESRERENQMRRSEDGYSGVGFRRGRGERGETSEKGHDQ
jgi:hypothetical protein